jgi:hypothetical protein
MQTAPHMGEAYEEETIEPPVDPHDLYWFKSDPPQERVREDGSRVTEENVELRNRGPFPENCCRRSQDHD